MMELKRYSCITCGAPLKEQDGKFVCANCKNEFHLEEKISEEEVVSLNRATTDRNLLRFDDAFEEYELLLKKYPDNEMANWGAFLSFYGIVYEQDVDGKYIPTCHRFSEKPVESSKYYYLFNDEHKRRADEIEKLRVAILEKAKRIPPYDVFICYKATEERFGRPYPTKEASWARDVYEMLTHELKLRVFFAEKSLGDSNEEYEPHIYSALNSAKLMFVMTTGMENVNAVWVKNEWKRYSKYIQEGQKKTIRVVYDNIEPYDLPLELQKTQAINHNDIDWGKKVRKAAQAIFVDPLEEERKKKEAEEKARKEKEEAEARERAREEELQKMREAMEALKKQANAPKPAPAPTAAPVRRGEPADKYCVKCGAGNVSSAKFCAECGHNVFAPEFKQYCLECGTETELLKKFCPNCAKNNFAYDKDAYARELERRKLEELARKKREEQARIEAEEKRRRDAIARDFTIVRGVLEKYKGTDKNVVIPEVVTTIGDGAFSQTHVVNVMIPYKVTTIREFAFDDCTSLTDITVDESNANYKSVDGNLYSKDGKTLLQYACGKKEQAFIVPDGVVNIGKGAFGDCRALKSVTLANSVKFIGDSAFYGCGNLSIITMGNQVESIGHSAFGDCSRLLDISLPDSVKEIGLEAFIYCSSLKSIVIPKGMTNISESLFLNCKSLTSVTIPDSVTSIEYHAFSGCSSLKGITIPDSVTNIENWTFEHCNDLKYVTCPAIACKHLPKKNLQKVRITSGESIDERVFEGCESLTDITLPDSLTTIKDSAFYKCASLESIVIPESVTSIEENAFEACNSLTIYARAEKKPRGWYEKRGFLGIGIAESWNSDNRPVVWGYKGK